MRFDWDDGNRTKAQKHGLSVAEIEGFFRLGPRVAPDPSHSQAVVAQAANGQEALDKLGATPNVDLILLDIEMPVMDGLEFLRHAKLKTRAKICMLSSVAVSGSAHAAKARELGADGVVAKPSGTVSHDLEEKTGDELARTMRMLVAA